VDFFQGYYFGEPVLAPDWMADDEKQLAIARSE
jgi:EAL domain-containing protein (putative c-di-GMP-specific phosphodiesterase class I)